MTAGAKRRRRTGRAVGIAVVAGGAVAATVAALGFNAFGASGDGGGDSGALPPATATVERETLVDTQSESGELAYDGESTFTARAGGTITSLALPGSTVGRGKALCRVDDVPVLLMYGKLPAYRELAPGVEGADVAQFEENLAELGYTGFTVDETYSGSTATAVRAWQEDLGLPETGMVELGRVLFAPGAVRVGTHRVSVGEAVGPGSAILDYTGKTRVVSVDLDVADERLAKKGEAVTVKLPDGKRTDGKITAVETVIDAGDGAEQEEVTKLRLTVTVKDQKALDGFGEAAVKVEFTASEREDVLTVPVAALLALGDGGYGVQVVDAGATRIVPVETGLFAGGRVEVSGAGLAEGMTVGMPS
ncbi:efflux RND transporter periplasmic adaptor subunit [Phytomonospora endophytica]|uniref:Peptidoglycan hydrolase-like protein with peptidoglycan-binding domain n=1 Tax=Phytomonospora endophytica TaxID=714109 RepID=A0A841FEE1_9ACTN|nr:peptidoglycan-binding protein [Phytomonospora endophytica]MBB6032208.1 peptidoglycan hydrolase-like protein with peptidoglycan-binding domain [Phytomonospora endophytica]GIG68557.1 peptidoglycan-binding protein [Phytomonospora endophytica]